MANEVTVFYKCLASLLSDELDTNYAVATVLPPMMSIADQLEQEFIESEMKSSRLILHLILCHLLSSLLHYMLLLHYDHLFCRKLWQVLDAFSLHTRWKWSNLKCWICLALQRKHFSTFRWLLIWHKRRVPWALPVQEHGFSLHKTAFCDALALWYGWLPFHTPFHCACGLSVSVDHALSCAKGGFPSIRHNKFRDLIAKL